MQFNSIEFFIFILVILILINCIRKSYYQQAILLTGSYVFYWTTSNYFVLLLLFITVLSFQSGQLIHTTPDKTGKKIILAIALTGLLIPLGIFKYYNFGLEILHQIPLPLDYYLNLPLLGFVLPIGISFFTFSAISYVIDIYRGQIQPEPEFYHYALFVSYFPHLLAGPIVRAGQFLPQLKNAVSLSPVNLKTGVTIMVWGFLKKFVIADTIAPVVNVIFSNPSGLSSPYIAVGTILFGIQIYCDFSGYIDIALGTAEIIGLHLPKNFIRPYLSKNPTEFWKRWNITLSGFIMDYVYIPLGGNRKGKLRTYLNLEITMLLCGLWHGAAWNFVLWGGYHGILLSVHKLLAEKTRACSRFFLACHENLGIFVKILVTQYFIFLGWLMFRIGNFSQLIYCIQKFVLFDFNFSTQNLPPLWGITTIFSTVNSMSLKTRIFSALITLGIIIVLLHSEKVMEKIIVCLKTDWMEVIASAQLRYWLLYLAMMFLVLLLFSPTVSPAFIYYQF
jgi:alginate O-acetyltransferase complex protein AlgI